MKKFLTKCGLVLLSLVVAMPLTSLAGCVEPEEKTLTIGFSDSSVTQMFPSTSQPLTVRYGGEISTSATITTDKAYATVEGSVLSVSDAAVVGETVTVTAAYEGKSAALQVPINNVTLSNMAIKLSTDNTQLYNGEKAILFAEFTPANARRQTDVTYTFGGTAVLGTDYTYDESSRQISCLAAGKTLVVTAVCESFTKELSIEFVLERESTNMLLVDNHEIDFSANFVNTLDITFKTAKGENKSLSELEYSIVSGDTAVNNISIDKDGKITVLGHGTTTVRVREKGTTLFRDVTVTTNVPPSDYIFRGMLAKAKANKPFYFGTGDVSFYYNAAEKLGIGSTLQIELTAKGYAATSTQPAIADSRVDQDFKALVTATSAAEGFSAVFTAAATRSIAFEGTADNATLTILPVKTYAGAKTKVQPMVINDGLNVNTLIGMAKAMRNWNSYEVDDDPASYFSNAVNLVGDINYAEYGGDKNTPADCVFYPADSEKFGLQKYLMSSFGSRTVNGNDYSVDLTGMRIITSEEDGGADEGGGYTKLERGMIEFCNIVPVPDPAPKVTIRDMTMVGIIPKDYATAKRKGIWQWSGNGNSFLFAISTVNQGSGTWVELTVDNVHIQKFDNGIGLHEVTQNTEIKNSTFGDIFTNCIEVKAAIAKFTNNEFYGCGYADVFFHFANSDRARIYDDQGGYTETPTKISMKGNITDNKHTGNTRYMLQFKFLGLTHPQIQSAAFNKMTTRKGNIEYFVKNSTNANPEEFESYYHVIFADHVGGGGACYSTIEFLNDDDTEIFVPQAYEYKYNNIRDKTDANFGKILLDNGVEVKGDLVNASHKYIGFTYNVMGDGVGTFDFYLRCVFLNLQYVSL